MAWFTPAGVGRGPWGFCCWQPVLCYGRDPKLAKGKGCHPDAIVHTESAERLGHPCSKPVKFWSWLMERASEPTDLIYDPFAGSGTTLIAAEMTGRVARVIEIDPAYVDITIRRWSAFTGREAVLAGDGLTLAEVAQAREVAQ
jgi:DNA modification methylase